MPFLRHRFQAVPASARAVIGEPSSRNRCSASAGKAATRRRHVVGVGRGKGGHARRGLFQVVADAEPATVGEGAGEAIGHRHEFQPVGFQFICIFSVEGGAGEKAQIHRAEIVPETGKGEFAGPDGAADHAAALENRSFPAFQRQMRGACQTVVARPDKYGVELAHGPVPNPLCLKIIADAYVFV